MSLIPMSRPYVVLWHFDSLIVDDIHVWLADNMAGRYMGFSGHAGHNYLLDYSADTKLKYVDYTVLFLFEKSEDATLFKLTWNTK